MFDTHCHLNFDQFDHQLENVIREAKSAGVTHFMVPGTSIETSKKAFGVSISYKNVFAACGIHPTEDLEIIDFDREMESLSALVGENETVLAVGEIGLDYYSFTAPARVQQKYLLAQLKLALKYGKAAILHSRHAGEDMVKTLNKLGQNNFPRTVFHCCEADKMLLDFALSNLIFVGVDGDATYDPVKQNFIKNVPLELLVLETDSPFLLPKSAKAKGEKFNTPKNLVYVCEAVAEIKNISSKKMAKISKENAKRLFGLS